MANKPLKTFQNKVWKEGKKLYRDLPWRRTTTPYEVFLSEVMLQQTQVSRVQKYWNSWLQRFPTVEVLAEASVADVLEAWQGMGYNRRALALHKASKIISKNFTGVFPDNVEELTKLPGVGTATAGGLLAFAFNKPSLYLETNVRAVILHEIFPGATNVPDKELIPIVEQTCPGLDGRPYGESDGPRMWYYAMLDYGNYLKKKFPNPSRRSQTATKQSTFEGSRRQKRAELIRILLETKQFGFSRHESYEASGLSLDALTHMLSEQEIEEGRPEVDALLVQSIMEDLEKEGFCQKMEGPSSEELWFIA